MIFVRAGQSGDAIGGVPSTPRDPPAGPVILTPASSRTGLLTDANRNSKEEITMKVSFHMGKGSAKHNDRSFNVEKADHIDLDRSPENINFIFQNHRNYYRRWFIFQKIWIV